MLAEHGANNLHCTIFQSQSNSILEWVDCTISISFCYEPSYSFHSLQYWKWTFKEATFRYSLKSRSQLRRSGRLSNDKKYCKARKRLPFEILAMASALIAHIAKCNSQSLHCGIICLTSHNQASAAFQKNIFQVLAAAFKPLYLAVIPITTLTAAWLPMQTAKTTKSATPKFQLAPQTLPTKI